MIKIITAPEDYTNIEGGKFIFLAGTIDNGDSEDWQKDVCEYAKTLNSTQDIYIINPRREKWDPEAGTEEVEKQVMWELGALKRSSYILMNILETSKSPITLLELGIFKDNPGLYVFCKPGFYRYTNVKVVCKEFDIKLYNNYTTESIKKLLNLIV